MDANTIIAISSIITPLSVMVATIYVARIQLRTDESIKLGNVVKSEINNAVHTSDGKPISELIETSTARDAANDAAKEN